MKNRSGILFWAVTLAALVLVVVAGIRAEQDVRLVQQMGVASNSDFLAKDIWTGKSTSSKPYTVVATDSGKVLLDGAFIVKTPQKVWLEKMQDDRVFLCGESNGCMEVAR